MLSVVVSFQLTKPAKIVGILTSLDSLSLVNRVEDYMKRDLVFRDNRYYGKIEWPYNLPPTNDNFWFRLYMNNEDGTRTYSPVFRQAIATYQIKNVNIVNGKGSFNKHPKDFFMNYEGVAIGTYDNSLMVEAVTSDVNSQNYKGTLNDVNVSINKVDLMVYPASHKQVVFDVPDDYPLGQAIFKLYHLNKLVLTQQVNIVNGGLLTKDQHVLNSSAWQSIFVHNNELYTFFNGFIPSESKFYKWNTDTKTLSTLSIPNFTLHIGNIDRAFSLNGIVYFPPANIRPWGIFSQYNPYYYKEVITTYELATNTWSEIELLNTKDINLDRGLDVLESFVIGDNIYSIIRETPQNTNIVRCVLKVFNVKDKSWKEYMELPNKLYKATVLDGKVYVLTSGYDVQEGATDTFKNEFMILDLQSKSFSKKSWISNKNAGTQKPYLTAFGNKIYVYGGQYSSGYSSLYSSLFAVYDPSIDKWSPVSGYSYFTAWVSQTNGFMLPINNKLYIGLGLDRYTNGNIYGSVRNFTISQLSIK
ncbi:hypothetical protein ACFQ1J_13095 [Pedobacter boryungensis]